MSNNRPIGVFDSGLGGLTVVKELKNLMPNEDIIYFGDTGRVPYGNRSVDTIKRYAREDEAFLLKQDVKVIIAACGTVSSVAADVSNTLPIPFFEVVTHACAEAVRVTKNGKIGVIGTAATVKSGKHKEHILKLKPDAQVFAQSCPLFVSLVEEGWYRKEDMVVKETVSRYLKPLIDAGVDTVILGCTHYPVLSDVIGKVMGKGVTLINAGTQTAMAVLDYLKKNEMLNVTGNLKNSRFFVSDKAESFVMQASVLLGKDIDESKVSIVDLSSL